MIQKLQISLTKFLQRPHVSFQAKVFIAKTFQILTLQKTHRFKNHPSIITIKEKVISDSFDFRPLTEIFKRNEKNSTTGVSIGLLKMNLDICAPPSAKILNSCISDGIFQNDQNLSDITPMFKSVDSAVKEELLILKLLCL